MLKLSQMRPSQSGRIVGVASGGAMSSRLCALGLMPGVRVRVVGVAPFGDPMMLQMESSRVSLRREEAEMLTVEPAS